MTSFTASPSTITEGDTFTLGWTAPCGFVSIGTKGQAQFALNRPSSGSYELRAGLTGYPTVTGATVYEATNGDAAPRINTTVTVNPRPTPTPAANRAPTVSVTASASTCHPRSPTQPCTVTCNASASDPDGDTLTYSWFGCASGGSSSATCAVSSLSTFTCSVDVSDGRGGTASGGTSVTGVNTVPELDAPACCSVDSGGPCVTALPKNTVVNCGFVVGNNTNAEADALTCHEAWTSGSCSTSYCGDSSIFGMYQFRVQTSNASGSCTLAAWVSDPWANGPQQTVTFAVE